MLILMSVKKDLRKPLIYLAVLAVLLGYRLVTWAIGRFSAASRGSSGSASLNRRSAAAD